MRSVAPVTLTLLTLALAPALHAQWRGGHDRYEDRRWDGDHRGYSYPGPAQVDRVARLAHEIHETSAYIHRKFERNNRRPDWAERRAMQALHELDEQAGHLHAEVETYRPNPRHTVNDFRRLEQAFYGALRPLEAIAARPYVDQGMERIYVLMNELARYYGRRSGYGGWRSHYSRDPWRYDQGGYDRDGHRRGGHAGDPDRDGGGRYGDPGAYDYEDTDDDPQPPGLR